MNYNDNSTLINKIFLKARKNILYTHGVYALLLCHLRKEDLNYFKS